MGTTLWLDKSQVAAKKKAELAEQAEAAEKGILRPKLSRQKKNKHIRQALFSIHKSITSDTCAALLQKTCGTSANNNSVR